MAALLNTFEHKELDDFLENSSGDMWLGLSGGLDSVVLLHLLFHKLSSMSSGVREEISHGTFSRLKVIHINHALSPNADSWQQFCADICRQYNIYFESHKVAVRQKSQSIEEAARIARYDVFVRQLKKNDALLLAHHANDQAETILFRLLRGTGTKGLAGIPDSRVLGEGKIIRPLLAHVKEQLHLYADYHQLSWVEDESNLNTQYSRNFIRHRIMPVLEEFEPQAAQRFTQAASRVAFDYRMLTRFALEALTQYKAADGSLWLSKLVTYSLDEKVFWLRHYLQELSISLTQPQLLELEQSMFSASDRQPCFLFADGRLMRYQERLYVLPNDAAITLGDLLAGESFARQFDDITLKIIKRSVENSVEEENFSLGKRPDGMSITLANGHSRKLKKWLNDKSVPLWWRDHLPYIFYRQQLVAIGSLWVTPELKDSIDITWSLNGGLPWPKVCDEGNT